MLRQTVFFSAVFSACILFYVFFGALPAAAMETFIVSPRAMGMGGAGVASVDDASAQYYNPAAFGFFGRKSAGGDRIEVDNNGAQGSDLHNVLKYH